jgi:integrase
MTMPHIDEITPAGHLQVRPDSDGRSYYAFWTDAHSKRGSKGKHCRKLGPAHVKATGKKTARGATIWRRGDGPKPTPRHLTPREAQEKLDNILAAAPRTVIEATDRSLRAAGDGFIRERKAEKGLTRNTVKNYEDLFERMYRDLGGDRLVEDFDEDELRAYFTGFVAQKAVGTRRAAELRRSGVAVKTVVVERWTTQPASSRPIEVPTKQRAVKSAARLGGKWKHEAPGVYRVTPPGAQRPRRVRRSEAVRLRAEGWHVALRETKRWVVCSEASPETRNKYLDLLGAAFAYAKQRRWVATNIVDDIPRSSGRADHDRVLRRDDFYDRDEVARLLAHIDDPLVMSFLLTGFDGSARLPGEGQGLRWSSVDFDVDGVHICDNWVENELVTTKTGTAVVVPMTPRYRAALWELYQRGYCTGPNDFVHVADELGRPVSEKTMRAAYRAAAEAAGLKEVDMYHARHAFGFALARAGVDMRTLQAYMRHRRLSTTQRYMPYRPDAAMAARITHALQDGGPDSAPLVAQQGAIDVAALLSRLDEEIPAKHLREVQRICDDLLGSTPNVVAALETDAVALAA